MLWYFTIVVVALFVAARKQESNSMFWYFTMIVVALFVAAIASIYKL